VAYDPINGQNYPSINGFACGVHVHDGSTAYVALGNGASCNNQLQAPCSLNINGPSPGCNIPCGESQIFDGKTASYLLKNPNLVWQPTDAKNVLSITDSLKVLGANNFRFGRVQVNGNYILGKVDANGFYGFETLTYKPIQNTTGFEVLTCRNPSCCCEFVNYIFKLNMN
jgi:hypothetical protein